MKKVAGCGTIGPKNFVNFCEEIFKKPTLK
jgi:hypothetical protein